MTQQTAVEWLQEKVKETYSKENRLPLAYILDLINQAKEMERAQRIKDYNAGYVDAQVNHVNDAVNYVYESEYIKSRIDEIDNEIKARQDYIANMLINGDTNNK